MLHTQKRNWVNQFLCSRVVPQIGGPFQRGGDVPYMSGYFRTSWVIPGSHFQNSQASNERVFIFRTSLMYAVPAMNGHVRNGMAVPLMSDRFWFDQVVCDMRRSCRGRSVRRPFSEQGVIVGRVELFRECVVFSGAKGPFRQLAIISVTVGSFHKRVVVFRTARSCIE